MWMTFEKIAPYWSKVLDEGKNLLRPKKIGSKTLHIKKYQFCVVGEAHGFDGGYAGKAFMEYGDDPKHFTVKRCNKCNNFGMEFMTALETKKYGTKREFIASLDEVKTKFTLHFNQKHNDDWC